MGLRSSRNEHANFKGGGKRKIQEAVALRYYAVTMILPVWMRFSTVLAQWIYG
jgi:hypothetical protein